MWYAYGSVAQDNESTRANGIVGAPMYAVVGPLDSEPAPTYSPETAYGPTTAAGLGLLILLGGFPYRPTVEEVEALRKVPQSE